MRKHRAIAFDCVCKLYVVTAVHEPTQEIATRVGKNTHPCTVLIDRDYNLVNCLSHAANIYSFQRL